MFAAKGELFTRPSGYQISRSVRFRASATAYFNRTQGTPTNGYIWTWSGWVKRGSLGSTQMLFSGGASAYAGIQVLGTDVLEIFRWSGAAYTFQINTTQVFRDPSAWYHIVVAVDGTQATAANRVKLYVNGVQVTSFTTANYPAQNTQYEINQNATAAYISRAPSPATQYFDGYLTETNFVDGQALTPSSFGENDSITGVWKPKKYAGTYGTNGFYLNFSDNSAATAAAIGKDYSGNGNNWTPNNISLTAGATYDSMLDVPTPYADGGNGRGNYAVLNPLNKATSDVSLSSGNLEASSSFTGDHRCFASTFQVTTGKWYWEVQYATGTINAGSNIVGIFNLPTPATANNRRPADSVNNGIGIRQDGQSESDNTVAAYFGSSISVGDIIGVALDADAGTVKFNVNNGSFGSTLTFVSAGGVYTAGGDIRALSGTPKTIHNFGQRPFAYTPPSGFKALNTQNLPIPTIANGANYMAATLYTGNGSTQSLTNTVNGISFQPDFVWVKARSLAYSNYLYDSVRGTGTSKSLISDVTAVEGAGSANANLTSFDASGFSLGTTSGLNGMNANAGTFVGWQWNAGGSTVTNTSGSISSQVRANPTAGFSVVTYTGNGLTSATVGHGLGVAPSMMIVKGRSNVDNWPVFHTSIGATKGINLNLTSASYTWDRFWNNTAPSSTVFTIGGPTVDPQVNGNGVTYVAYCFAAVAGYSAFGSYTGNGSTDGPFVFTGFRPRFLMVKRTDGVGDWMLLDSSRDRSNMVTKGLAANLSSAEGAGDDFDFVANGFKLRDTGTGNNANGGTYIYMAFAENPFKYSLAR